MDPFDRVHANFDDSVDVDDSETFDHLDELVYKKKMQAIATAIPHHLHPEGDSSFWLPQWKALRWFLFMGGSFGPAVFFWGAGWAGGGGVTVPTTRPGPQLCRHILSQPGHLIRLQLFRRQFLWC